MAASIFLVDVSSTYSMLFSMINGTPRHAPRKRRTAPLDVAASRQNVEPHPAFVEWIWNHKDVESFILEYDILLKTRHPVTSLKTKESDSTISLIEVNPTNTNISNIMLTVKEFDMPKCSIQSIHDALTMSEDILNLYQKHIGAHPEVNFSRFGNCVEIHSEVRNNNISIKLFIDNTIHITGFKDPSMGLDMAWMMHQIVSSMHPPAARKSHVCVNFDNVHADFSMSLPSTCVMNTIKMRELVNDGALDQFENEDFEFVHVQPDYRFVSRNKQEYTGLRINVMFRMYENTYQVCVTPFATGNCIIRSKHPEAINKMCTLMIKFFSLM